MSGIFTVSPYNSTLYQVVERKRKLFLKLILIFTMVPIIELTLLIKIGQHVGILFTILLVAFTGIAGVSLARSQGYRIIKRIKSSLNRGEMPADDLIGGLLILIGGTMLLTPGLLTDLTGFSLIIPVGRTFYTRIIKSWFKKYMKKNNLNFNKGFSGGNANEDDFIDIETERKK